MVFFSHGADNSRASVWAKDLLRPHLGWSHSARLHLKKKSVCVGRAFVSLIWIQLVSRRRSTSHTWKSTRRCEWASTTPPHLLLWERGPWIRRPSSKKINNLAPNSLEKSIKQQKMVSLLYLFYRCVTICINFGINSKILMEEWYHQDKASWYPV